MIYLLALQRSLLDLGLHAPISAVTKSSEIGSSACKQLVDLGKDPYVDKLAQQMHKQVQRFMGDRFLGHYNCF